MPFARTLAVRVHIAFGAFSSTALAPWKVRAFGVGEWVARNSRHLLETLEVVKSKKEKNTLFYSEKSKPRQKS